MRYFLALAVLMAAHVISATFLHAQDSSIAEFSGNGLTSTRPFTATGPWEINWSARGDVFQIFVYTGDGQLVGVAANQQGPGDGSSYQATGGSYYLQVNAIGQWSVEVAQAGGAVDSPPAGAALLVDSGNGAKTTRPFRSDGPWEIAWNASGDIFQVFVYKGDGTLAGVAANQSGAGTGSSYQASAGEYYLQVNALGQWQLQVTRFEQ